MAKYGLLALVLAFVGIVASAGYSSQDAEAGAPCKHTKFETKLVGDACAKGGQGEAKKVMKKFVKKAKKQDASVECKTCHTKLAPNYDLKPDALQKFKALGGK
jgi:hypothetical protein